ncbi:MAG: ASKHA domain-containing protein [Thermodesulfobacteriota bacterium]
MPIVFEPMHITMESDQDRNLYEHALSGGVWLRSECGGKGLCGQCQVTANPRDALTPPTPKEEKRLAPDELAGGFRLACQARPLGPVTVNVPVQVRETGEALGKTGLTGPYPVNPMVERLFLPWPRPGYGEEAPRSYFETLGRVYREHCGRELPEPPLEIMRRISRLPKETTDLTLALHRRRGLTAVWPGRRDRCLGLALDVGTTTLAAYLCDLVSGRVLASSCLANPQRAWGEDVITRITHTFERPGGLDALHRAVVAGLNEVAGACLNLAGADREDIDEATVAGNPTMLHLVAGLDPGGLGVAPYLPVSRFIGDLRAGDLGLDLNPAANVHFLPLVSGFVGGDAVAAALAVDMPDRDETCLMVDLGTNGELVLGGRRGLWATSCATGPAFEGAHIACGLRAVTGAVESVDLDPTALDLSYRVIGGDRGAKPLGLCGSGIIDAVAALLRAGWLERNGRLSGAVPPDFVPAGPDQNKAVVLVPPGQSGTGRALVLTQADVRQVQLAKAAVAVGIRFLLKASGLARVDRLVLTGAFGARFDWKSAMEIGLLPPAVVGGRVETRENAAGEGAIMVLLDRDKREEAVRLAQQIRPIELSRENEFQGSFIQALGF